MKQPIRPTQPEAAPAARALRPRAEPRLQTPPPATAPAHTEAARQRLIHDLQAHQTELERQNEELRQAHRDVTAGLEKYRDLYAFAPVAYLTLDRGGAIEEANLAAAGLLGTARDRVLQRHLGLFIAEADRPAFADFLNRVHAGQRRELCEVHLLREGQSAVEVRIEAISASGEKWLAVLEDITEQKRAEADRLILKKLESISVLATGIAHDFNNLLTVILLDLELAQEPATSGQEATRLMEEAKKACWTARGLTQQILAFASGDAPVRQLNRLAGLIRESSLAALNGSPVPGEFALPDDLWPAEVDAVQIGQVIRNLVQNAREATPAQGVVRIRAENVVLGAREQPLPPGDYVRISIIDQGGGIGMDTLAKIFDPYFSTKPAKNQKGMGLGLTISYSIIKKHGGTITVQSELGAGSTFEIFLPALRPRTEPPVEKNAVAARPCTGRILVMDDEDSVRHVLGTTLQRMGHEVGLAADGSLAVKLYEEAQQEGQPFDVVLLDLTVHAGTGGQETLRTLLKFDPAVQAVVMTGYSGDPVLLEPEQYGFQGGLAKPFSCDQLQQILDRIMTHRAAS